MGSFYKYIEFWATIIVGGIIMGFAVNTGDLKIEVTTVGLYVSLVLGLIAADVRRADSIESSLEDSQDIGLRICQDRDVEDFYQTTVESLCKVFRIRDTIFLKLAKSKLKEFKNTLATELSQGMISFPAQAFRVHYIDVLNQRDVKEYSSVAWVKSEDYWQDEAGKYTIKFNYELVKKKGKTVERIFIIRDSNPSLWNSKTIRDWIREQSENGIHVGVAKESRIIESGEDLLYDIGIYGNRAVGYMISNDQCKPLNFQFYFNVDKIEEAKRRFDKLKKFWALNDDELADFLKKTKLDGEDEASAHTGTKGKRN